ncbi:MAG: hypothetical protein DRI26_02640 [Chloroflexi bacterium]|nr:MAG: hypothetical protein DRI26_02640 [Chloroflexota bacterium]
MSSLDSLRKGLSAISTYPEELGLDLNKPADRFKWLLASVLFSKRISAEIAKRTFQKFEAEGLLSPESLLSAGWDRLVEVLDAGGYVRYDFSTASNLLSLAENLRSKYGSLEELYAQAKDSQDLEKKLQEFKGVGPTTVSIFLRELRGVWEKAHPRVSPLAQQAASRLGLGKELEEQPELEPRLVKLHLEFCKRGRCSTCPVSEFCHQKAK